MAWSAALALPAKPAADDIDRVLHWERRVVGGARVSCPAPLSELPDGVFIARDGESWLVNGGGPRRFTPAGYAERIDRFDGPARGADAPRHRGGDPGRLPPAPAPVGSDAFPGGGGWLSARVESD